jgi:hypothetical protein
MKLSGDLHILFALILGKDTLGSRESLGYIEDEKITPPTGI